MESRSFFLCPRLSLYIHSPLPTIVCASRRLSPHKMQKRPPNNTIPSDACFQKAFTAQAATTNTNKHNCAEDECGQPVLFSSIPRHTHVSSLSALRTNALWRDHLTPHLLVVGSMALNIGFAFCF